MSAARTADGGTAVLISVHHLFGTGGGIFGALYGDGGLDPTVGTTEAVFSSANDFTVGREALAVGNRIRLGLPGAGRLVSAAPAALRRRPPADGAGGTDGTGGANGADGPPGGRCPRRSGRPAGATEPAGRHRTAGGGDGHHGGRCLGRGGSGARRDR